MSKVIGIVQGEYDFPEISNDEDDWEIGCRFTSGNDEFKNKISDFVRKVASTELCKEIRIKYVEELMKK